MPSTNNYLIQATSLLSQHLAQLKPEGDLFKLTSCLNFEEREIIGILSGVLPMLSDGEEKKLIKELIIPFFEAVGIGKWNRTELTDLGLRVGQRHKIHIDLSSDIPVLVEAKVDGTS
jgi:hypothetical protein